jgi:hypothetical protein
MHIKFYLKILKQLDQIEEDADRDERTILK